MYCQGLGQAVHASFDINPETTPNIERELTIRIASQVDVHQVIIPEPASLSDILKFGTTVLDASKVGVGRGSKLNSAK